LSSALVRI